MSSTLILLAALTAFQPRTSKDCSDVAMALASLSAHEITDPNTKNKPLHWSTELEAIKSWLKQCKAKVKK